MESRHVSHEASKFAPEDFISNMPDIVITNILDRLPLQEAVSTSILSRKGVKDLTIWNDGGELFDLPTHIFSCLDLKKLELSNCRIDPPAGFHGFPNLLSLNLDIVEFENGKFGKLFNQCPVLEIFNFFYTNCKSKVKLSEITRLSNLKDLKLSLRNLDNNEITSSSSIFDLLGFLPELQVLELNFRNFKFTEFGDRKRSPTTFPCLKTLILHIDFYNDIMFAFDFELIRSFPNLQSLEITANACINDPPPAICSVDYNTMGLLQLRRVAFTNLKDSTNEVCLVEYVLACSPFLKQVFIHAHSTLGSYEKLQFAKKLLVLRRASPLLKSNLSNFSYLEFVFCFLYLFRNLWPLL